MTADTYELGMSQPGTVQGAESSRKRKQQVQCLVMEGVVTSKGLEVETDLPGMCKIYSIQFQRPLEATKWY